MVDNFFFFFFGWEDWDGGLDIMKMTLTVNNGILVNSMLLINSFVSLLWE